MSDHTLSETVEADPAVLAEVQAVMAAMPCGVSVFDVAEYILAEHGEMATMKLQKLLYFIQGWSLAWTGEPLFDEDFEAWASGPVCRELCELHRGEYSVGPGFFTAKLREIRAIETARAARRARTRIRWIAAAAGVLAVTALLVQTPRRNAVRS